VPSIGVSMKNLSAFFLLLGVLFSVAKSEGLIMIILLKHSGFILQAIREKEEDSPVDTTSAFSPTIFLMKSVTNCT
jgi:hypothetical protein